MEAISLIFVFVAYILIRLLLGHHKTQTLRDKVTYKEGIWLVEEKKYAEAIAYFEKVLAKNPQCGIAWEYKGEAHLKLNNYYHCLADCSKALDIDYNLRNCYIYKGIAFLKLGNFREAHTEFDKAVWHFREKHPETFKYRGLCHYNLGDYKKAEADFAKAIKMGDEDANYLLMKMKNKSDVL